MFLLHYTVERKGLAAQVIEACGEEGHHRVYCLKRTGGKSANDYFVTFGLNT